MTPSSRSEYLVRSVMGNMLSHETENGNGFMIVVIDMQVNLSSSQEG